MSHARAVVLLLTVILTSLCSLAQSSDGSQPAVESAVNNQGSESAQDDATVKEITDQIKHVKAIQDALKGEDPDFGLVLGIGSLVTGPGVTDYQNQSNVIHSSYLGRATPQLLTGVSFRTNIPNFRKFQGGSNGAIWQKRPWNAFLSLKFAPGSSQTLNGFVLGGSWAFAHYLNALIGFALTPVNEPSPGFKATAAQFVIGQQKQGLDLNFDPNAMLRNAPNAFDGFPVTDSSGRLIYQGDPLTVHYRGGVVFGVSVPIYFKSVFGGS